MQGNKWTCPESGRISVAASLDEVLLGDLFCSDGQGPSGATSRHAVIDMLVIDRGLNPSLPDQARLPCKHMSFLQRLISKGLCRPVGCACNKGGERWRSSSSVCLYLGKETKYTESCRCCKFGLIPKHAHVVNRIASKAEVDLCCEIQAYQQQQQQQVRDKSTTSDHSTDGTHTYPPRIHHMIPRMGNLLHQQSSNFFLRTMLPAQMTSPAERHKYMRQLTMKQHHGPIDFSI